MDTSSRISRIRSRERERLRGPPWLKVLESGHFLMSLSWCFLGLILDMTIRCPSNTLVNTNVPVTPVLCIARK